MALHNKSMYAILGILNLQPCTGYEIKKYSDKVLSGFWNENFGHIYPTLKTMLQDGMIAVVPGDETEKKVSYQITEKGKDELNTWLNEETQAQPVRSEFMLKLLFSEEQSSAELEETLTKLKKRQQIKIEQYSDMLKQLEAGVSDVTPRRAGYMRAILRRGVISAEGDIRWCEEIIREMCR